MPKKEKATKEALGSKNGTTLLKVKKTKSGIKVKASTTAYELINILAILIDEVAVSANVSHGETLEAVVELLNMKEGN